MRGRRAQRGAPCSGGPHAGPPTRRRLHAPPERDVAEVGGSDSGCLLRMPTKILDFGGFDSGRILILRRGILRSIGNCTAVLSLRILVGINLVGRLGVAIHKDVESCMFDIYN